jgi:sRNA-binding carbon storage regulator CsrA
MSTPQSKVKLFTIDPQQTIDVDNVHNTIDEFISKRRTTLYTNPLLDVVNYRDSLGGVCIAIRYNDNLIIDIDVTKHSISLWTSVGRLIEAPRHIKTYVLELLEEIAKKLKSPYKDSIEIIANWLKQKTAE